MASNPLIGSPKTWKKLLSDLLIWMVDNERNFCCTAIEITNSTGAEKTYDIGTVVADAALADNADPSGLQPAIDDALTIERVTIPDGESRNVAALVRGPALVNFNAITRVTPTETDNQVIARLDGLIAQGVRFKKEPAGTSRPDLNS